MTLPVSRTEEEMVEQLLDKWVACTPEASEDFQGAARNERTALRPIVRAALAKGQEMEREECATVVCDLCQFVARNPNGEHVLYGKVEKAEQLGENPSGWAWGHRYKNGHDESRTKLCLAAAIRGRR